MLGTPLFQSLERLDKLVTMKSRLRKLGIISNEVKEEFDAAILRERRFFQRNIENWLEWLDYETEI